MGHMATKQVPPEKVVQYLRLHKVGQTSELAERFNCSKRTIFRILQTPGYLTSYNGNRSALTLSDIPEFNSNGLWDYQGFRFSRWRTLKKTIQHLVDNSEAGLSAGELRQLLHHDNIYHHVTSCVSGGIIFRDTGWTFPIYYSMDPQKGRNQREIRNRILQRLPLRTPPYLSKDKIIQVLVVALKHHISSVEKIMPVLRSEGIHVTERSVKWIFEHYEIEKKGSPSPSSKL